MMNRMIELWCFGRPERSHTHTSTKRYIQRGTPFQARWRAVYMECQAQHHAPSAKIKRRNIETWNINLKAKPNNKGFKRFPSSRTPRWCVASKHRVLKMGALIVKIWCWSIRKYQRFVEKKAQSQKRSHDLHNPAENPTTRNSHCS